MEGEVEAVRELERIKGLRRKAQDESRTDKVTHELVSTGNGNEATLLPLRMLHLLSLSPVEMWSFLSQAARFSALSGVRLPKHPPECQHLKFLRSSQRGN